MKKLKNKKTIIILLLVIFVGVVGVTYAFLSKNISLSNIFKTKPYGTTVTEKFVSPDNWTPGTTTEKTVMAKNTGEVDVAVRVSYTEKWVAADGTTELSGKQNGESVAIVNFSNTFSWIKDGDYYYYRYKLAKGESTTSVIKSVTYNENAMADTNCETNENIVNCTASGADYDGASYTLTLKIETIQYDKYKEAWETSIDISDEKVTSLASFVTSNGVKYTGNGANTYENDVYFLTDNTNNNVLFANYCWKIVRTTETGGVKLIYNGEPNDGKCNNSGDDTTIGKSAFNTNYSSPSYVGYMYNKVYEWKSGATTTGSLYGKNVKYENGVYTLEDTSDTLDASHHYTCNDDSVTCETVRYYYYSSDSNYYYIELTGTKNIASALSEMLSNDNVNKNDSTIKAKIDNWYKENMTDYTDYLEDTVFCNDRSIASLGGWYPDGGSLSDTLKFKEYNVSGDLICSNNIDKFTVSKSIGNGALIYPVGLLSRPEANFWGSTARNSSNDYWLGSPYYYVSVNARGRGVKSDGGVANYLINSSDNGIRPSISLEPNTIFTKGDGTTDSPFIIATE